MQHSTQQLNPACPICNRPILKNCENIYIPFCSTRCKTIDLGIWLSDNYRIPVKITDEDETVPADNETNLSISIQEAKNNDSY